MVIKQIEDNVRNQLNKNLQVDENLPDLSLNDFFNEFNPVVISSNENSSITSQESIVSDTKNRPSVRTRPIHNTERSSVMSEKRGINYKHQNNSSNLEEIITKRVRKPFVPYQHVPATTTRPRAKVGP